MGVVYRAEDTRLKRTVALKFLPPMLTPNPRAKARFMNEARAASALDHPNLCTIYEIGETAEGQLYLAMPFYEGETLKRRLERGPLPVVEALQIALQVARGLAKAHHHGIVHRDIKPANLMMTTDGIVKVLDFGIARLPDQAQSAPFLGTLGYMSPEQACGRAVDAASDVWSLGVVLREMLTGRRPSPGGTEEDPAGKEPPAPLLPQGAPPGTARILSHMMAEVPADRYPDAVALLADLSELERAAIGTTGERATGLRRWLLAGVIFLAVTLGLAAVSWLRWSIRRQDGASLDPSTVTVTKLTDLSGKVWFPSLHPDGDYFVYARKTGDTNRLYRQRVGGDAQKLIPDSLEDDSQPAYSPDGKQIAFRSERAGGGIFLVGSTGESVRCVTHFGFNPAWSPDGKEIVFATERIVDPLIRKHPPSSIYRLNLAANHLELVSSKDAVQPSWSPHDLRIAYWGLSDSGQRWIWTIPAHGGKAVPVTDGNFVDWNPVWSPDGRFLYYASDRNGTTASDSGMTNLWRLQIDERSGLPQGEPKRVTTSDQVNMLFSLSRDGKRIAYTSDGSRSSLEKVAFDPRSGEISGSSPVIITQTQHMIQTLDTSRDGRWLVYQTSVPREELFVIRPDGTEGRQLIPGGRFRDRHPRWSPDGKRIAFYSNRRDKYEIWLVNADGSQLEPAAIIPPGRKPSHPIWSPDGRRMVFDLEVNAALIDLTRPLAERRAEFLPLAPGGMGFSASSWSKDDHWLAGAFHPPKGSQLSGVVLYSREDKSYRKVTKSGQGATWLSDNRRLLYWDSGKLFLLDTRKKTSHPVLTTPPGFEYNDLALSPDDRVLYLVRKTEESNISLLTMK